MTLQDIKYNKKGLISVIAQDVRTGEILMSAWANEEAINLTIQTGDLTLWSRSRQELWRKGATSGNTMKVIELIADCDADAVLALVEPAGPACHTGERTCFHNHLWGEEAATQATFLGRLYTYLKARNDTEKTGYTGKLLTKGPKKVAQKIGEEGVETALEVAALNKEGFIYEAADLLYHLLVGCLACEVDLLQIMKELEARHRK